uniref:EF-hand domain-containing protein n=1 Tax=Entomoneis paludosa TaxID=265537 RepID=A0A7S3DV64_9STRA
MGYYTFESFASWYSGGGYEVAPWLELLDLNKVFSLIGNSGFDSNVRPSNSYPPRTRDKMSSLRRHHSGRKGPPPEILFTFPLANQHSLIVLKDDATYVREVVEQLGLLCANPSDLWAAICKLAEKKKKTSKGSQGTVYVAMGTFLSCMEEVCPKLREHQPNHPERIRASEILSNFFQCFDLEQRDNVALDELMGGLTLLCGGKKSHKLSFAFGVFDTRPGIHQQKTRESITHSLSGEDLFLFLRSILIVTFSCCRQSLDMSDSDVGRCIADTANMICNDVMRYQWNLRHTERLNFDEFGQWYNEGGFERAPWLELLDLRKWVLPEDYEEITDLNEPDGIDNARPPPPTASNPDPDIPPPPPEDALDPDFFEAGIMPMDSIDEMDMILMQPSSDKDTDLGSPSITQSFEYSPTPSFQPSPSSQQPPLKFHLSTSDDHGGYTLSMSHNRISHLRRILESSSLHKMEAETVCGRILAKATKSKNPKLSRDQFDSAVGGIAYSENSHPGAREEERALFHLLSGIFAAFDRDGSNRVSAMEVACGFTVLCSGKKSDKLEFAFDVLDKRKRGQLSREDMSNYLKSFLTVLLNIAFSPNLKDGSNKENTLTTLQGQTVDTSPRALLRVVDSGAHWATSMAFDGHTARHGSNKSVSMSFDDFAEWYTTKGYSSIPWLELLDLRKWVFNNDP